MIDFLKLRAEINKAVKDLPQQIVDELVDLEADRRATLEEIKVQVAEAIGSAIEESIEDGAFVPDIDEVIDPADVIELVEAVRDGDRAQALRMLERLFDRDIRLVAAIQQARFERPRPSTASAGSGQALLGTSGGLA